MTTHTPAAESPLTNDDLYLFNEGSHFALGSKLGAHPTAEGTHFAVWAPNAERVAVIGDFNGWSDAAHPLGARGSSGIWESFIPGVGKGALYKFAIFPRGGGRMEKSDPFGLYHELPPKTASIVWDLEFPWRDGAWMKGRARRCAMDAPISIYEVHIGSWRHRMDDPLSSLSYRELAEQLPAYAAEMGFTHVELLPVMEHPFYGSWGYQTTGYFAPTSRFGTPQDFMHLIDSLHAKGIGVILDWVPSHFPDDAHGLARFDGTHLFEHVDPREGFHPDWNSLIFNYGRHEVRSFLISSALHWLDHYHIDGIRVDAVASMLYRDYSRKAGEWIPNEHGGRENLEAIALLRRMNEEIYRRHPDVQTYAEESTAWPMVSRPTWLGGLGFGFKWDMGWMHDTLKYMSLEGVYRKYHQNQLTFRMLYAWNENFVLPLSHDEVVHGKGSLYGKMNGDRWQKFANLRILFALMHAQSGKKLMFMGGEWGQPAEWNFNEGLEWGAMVEPLHRGAQSCMRDLNKLYAAEPALHELDCSHEGFEWIDCNDHEQSVIALLRKGRRPEARVAAVLNFTPVPRTGYRIGVPLPGRWREVFNSDARDYGGSGWGNMGGVQAEAIPYMGHPYSVSLALPPLGAVFLKPE